MRHSVSPRKIMLYSVTYMTLNFYAIRFKPGILNKQFAGHIGPTNMICAVLDAVQNQQEYQIICLSSYSNKNVALGHLVWALCGPRVP
jgi:hypothetical protein